MPDLTVTRDGELMVAQVQAETDAGEEFVDAWMPKNGQLVVVDSGRIIVPFAWLDGLTQEAVAAGLVVTVEERF